MGPLGFPEMFGIFVIALLLFGPKKLPELGRTLGKGLSEFRRAKNELKATFESHLQELEKETRIEPTKEFTPATYSYPYDEYGRYEESVPQVSSSAPNQLQAAESTTPLPVVHPPVAGTVARTNGIEPITASAEQEHKS